MAANTSPIFVDTPKFGHARISTANTGRDGSGTLGTVYTGTTDGSRISYIRIMATSTTTAGMVRLFIHDGTNFRLWDEILVSALTPSATVLGFRATIASRCSSCHRPTRSRPARTTPSPSTSLPSWPTTRAPCQTSAPFRSPVSCSVRTSACATRRRRTRTAGRSRRAPGRPAR